MLSEGPTSFEQIVTEGLERLDRPLKAARKGAEATAASFRMLNTGEIKNLPKKLAEAGEALSTAAEEIKTFQQWWDHRNVEDCLSSPRYLGELAECLARENVEYHQVADVLYVWPTLVRVDANAKAVKLGKKREPRIRPMTLARCLKKMQERPDKPSMAFLRKLFRAYKLLCRRNRRPSEAWAGQPVFLRDICEVISLGADSTYSEQEFAWDVYRLEASGERPQVDGYIAQFGGSSATRDARRTLEVVGRDGQKRVYCTVRFDLDRG